MCCRTIKLKDEMLIAIELNHQILELETTSKMRA